MVTQVATPYIQQFFAGDATLGSIFIKASPTPFMIRIGLFLVIVVLLTTRGGLAGMRGRGLLSPIEVAIYSTLNSAIILSSVLSFLDDGVRATLLNGSQLARYVLQFHDVWIIAPVVILVIMGFRRRGSSGMLQD